MWVCRKNYTSPPRRKARAKKPQQPKILGNRTERFHTPPVATLRRRGPQIQNNAPQRNEDSKGTRLPNPKADRKKCVGRAVEKRYRFEKDSIRILVD